MSDTPRTDHYRREFKHAKESSALLDWLLDEFGQEESRLTACQAELKEVQEERDKYYGHLAGVLWSGDIDKLTVGDLQQMVDQFKADKEQLARYKAAEAELPEEPVIYDGGVSVPWRDLTSESVINYADKLRVFAIAQVAARQAVEKDDLPNAGFYLQDKRSYVGNDMVWWGKDGNGYTTDLRKAHVFSQAEVNKGASRGTDIFWPVSYINKLARPAVDMQYAKRDDAALAAEGEKHD